MGRAPCCDKNGLKKGPWTPEEDLKLTNHIQANGPGNWRTLPKTAGLQRCGKSCRLRWTNYLRPDIKRGRFSFEEEEAIIQLHSILGNKWSAIAARLPGRTDNEIKNYWNTHIRKRLLRSGIDPVTHAPRLDLLDLSSILNSSLSCSNLLGLSSLLSTQALLNPEMLRLASTILSLNNENSDLISQNIPENTISDGNPELRHIETPVQQVPAVPCTANNVPCVPLLDQTQNVQLGFNVGEFSSGYFSNLSCPSSVEASLMNDTSFAPQPNYINCSTIVSENMDFNVSCSDSMNILSIDSIASTPLSSGSDPLNSSSTFINGGIEDERESYCSNFLKFEIPHSCLDISDYI